MNQRRMRVHLIPSHVSFGIGVITPRWLYVLAQATPARFGDPVIADETLEPVDVSTIAHGDIVGIGIHTGNALRGYELGILARAAGATVVFGGIHATLFPEEARDLGGAHAVVKGDGDRVWGQVLDDCAAGRCAAVYEGGQVEPADLLPARWDLLPENAAHPVMSADDIRRGTQGAWDRFYSFRNIWERAHCVESLKSRLAFVLISKLYRQMYANTGIATDSARVGRSAHWARWIAKPCRRLFMASPMPDLVTPV